ncbi:MAG TPA: hypothetical protein PK951_14795 [Chitinophagaceae bacterium]|nr:hypothetical protein [Chitinophagaceae bacterium]
MQKFEFVLKNEKLKHYKTLTLFVIFINIVFVIWLGITILVIAALVIFHMMKKNFGSLIAMLLIANFYVEAGYWAALGILILMALLYLVSIRPLVVQVSPTNILYPNFPKRKIEWDELNNLVLKDGLLTLDFKNNRIAQVTVNNEGNKPDVDEMEFNDFCRDRIGAGC